MNVADLDQLSTLQRRGQVANLHVAPNHLDPMRLESPRVNSCSESAGNSGPGNTIQPFSSSHTFHRGLFRLELSQEVLKIVGCGRFLSRFGRGFRFRIGRPETEGRFSSDRRYAGCDRRLDEWFGWFFDDLWHRWGCV